MKLSISFITTAMIASWILLTYAATAQLSEDKINEMEEAAKADLNENGFSFSFPDLKGNVVTNKDKRFADKVVLVDIFGTWCRPCRLQAPFLGELHKKYGKQGLEIVSIAFEFGDDKAKNIKKIKKFDETFGVKHKVLYGGSTDSAKNSIPLPVAKLGYPVVILIDRDGAVQFVEGGFWETSGEQIEAKVKDLLAEPAKKESRS